MKQIHQTKISEMISDANIYCILCKDYKMKYISKAVRNDHKHIYIYIYIYI